MSTNNESIESVDAITVEENADENDDANDLTRDNIFHLLQCRRRRLVLKYLQDHDTPVKMTDITEHIAAIEHDTTVAALRSQERQRVYIALYQSHLPKLDAEGIIEYQQNRGIVERTPLTSVFDRYLDEEPSMREDDGSERPTIEAGDDDRERSTSGWQPSYAYAGGAGVALALAVGIYATVANTPIPSGVGAATALIVLVMFATSQLVRDGADESDDE